MAPRALYVPLVGLLILALPLLVPKLPGQGGPTAAGPSDEEKLLEDAGLPTDGPGLVKFFRDRTLSGKDRARLAGLAGQLGSRSFAAREKATRELIAAGEHALEPLRSALKSPDPEVRRRAQECVEAVERTPHAARAAAAARVLAARRPEGAADALLAYLPFADGEAVGEGLLGPLVAVGLRGGDKDRSPVPAVAAALADGEPARRAAAAHVLGHAGPDQRPSLAPLLADPSPLVRYHAAVALMRLKDARGLAALVDLLGEGPAALSWSAEELLCRVAGEQAPPPVTGAPEDPAARKKWHAAWQAWWKANAAKVDVARLNLDDGYLGLTVVCEVDGLGQFPGRITEFDRGGNLRATVEGFESPSDVQRLPSGRLLLTEHWGSRVTERDRRGKIVWEHKVSAHPVSAERLKNGNTFIATYSEVVEVSPAGKTLFSYKHSGGSIYCACKLRSGNALLIDSSGRVVELDAAGKQVMTFTPQAHAQGAGYWASIEPLRNGRYLISLSGSGKVVETDNTGKIFWECSVPTPCYATRLPNGNTLVANVDGRAVVEVDRQGKEVWTKATKGRPFRARRY